MQFHHILQNYSTNLCQYVNFHHVRRHLECYQTFKSGSKLEVKDYRLISTLLFIGKVFEPLIYFNLYKFLDRYIYFLYQYDFFKNKTDADAILKFTDECYAFHDEKKTHDFNIFRFLKAFNIVNQEIICTKTRMLWIMEWLKSYLNDRFQYV